MKKAHTGPSSLNQRLREYDHRVTDALQKIEALSKLYFSLDDALTTLEETVAELSRKHGPVMLRPGEIDNEKPQPGTLPHPNRGPNAPSPGGAANSGGGNLD